MKVKLFTKLNPKNKAEPTHTELENGINDWLQNNPGIQIRYIQQSTGGGSMGPFLFCFTVWYDE